ncbi:hypothetical protein [Dyadobacter sediminis]|uniref:Tetratricopeptide repeat protein n=1 Tax=Dyadobacter sediminis TaxID=1493691 RepID=A0A5R9KDT7_9BACT|nr:hypothetical protein [Dyadobacter sediminis]TLU94227.1 hypothetical protein FEM55_08195 [Dyadobacter sediminis]GGB93106.1 hypothetical protein GCM10011325_20670 [Dyadobacter sediminis]
MNKLTFIIAVLLLAVLSVKAQDSPFQKIMKKEIGKINKADSLSQFQQSANAFSRIAELNPTEWQPLYYQALACTFQGMNHKLTPDKKDEALAKAEELVKKAEAISADNSEIIALKGFITMAKVSADPAGRGQSLSGQALAEFGRSLAIDSKNPRALALMAQMEAGIARFFGSGTEKACSLAKQSMAIFAAQDEEALTAAMKPTWGKRIAESMSKSCE